MVYKYLFAVFFALITTVSSGQGAGDFVRFRADKNHLIVTGTKGMLRVTTFTPDIFRVETIPAAGTPLDTSYTVVLKAAYIPANITETSTSLLVDLENSQLEITKSPLSVSLRAGQVVKIRDTGGFRQTKDSVSFDFDIDTRDVFHGAGSRPFGPDLNGKAFDFYNTWEYAYYDQATGLAQSFNVPFLVSSHRYGILFDSNQPGSMRMFVGTDSTSLHVQAYSTGQWAYYIVNGANNDEILENYTLLTGRQPLPPRWALGYIQSKFGYNNESEATVAVSKLQEAGFPLDGLALDMQWYGGQALMGNLAWDAKNWPDAAEMVTRLKSKGVRTILITDPYITTQSGNFRLADSLSFFAKKPGTKLTYTQNIWNGTAGLIDIFNPAASQWLWQQYKRLTQQGVAGWWTDKIEPDHDPLDAVYAAGRADQVHNLYALQWGKNLYEQFRRDFPEQRLFNLTRSGWAGSQRYGVLPWSGDVARYWAGLKLQIPIILQAGMSGIAYMHSDIGGFATMPDKEEKDEELDLRWFQFATFTPIVRAHGQRSSTEPFNLSEPFYTHVKRYLHLRYRLLPYIYSLVWKNAVSGRPICMPMDYFTPDPAFGNINDQYFFGENLLVAPVLLHGMLSRKVILPDGKWFDFWTSQPVAGGRSIFPKLGLDDIPVYARAGSFIPMSAAASLRSTDAYTSDSLSVRFFQDVSVPVSAFTMYHDDGMNPDALKNNQYELLEFAGRVSDDSIHVSVSRKADHPAALAKRNLLLEMENVTAPPLSVTMNGAPMEVVYLASDFQTGKAFYDLVSRRLQIRFDWDCKTAARISVLREGLSLITGTGPRSESGYLKVYPNPGQPGTPLSVDVNIPETGTYTLEIYDVSGVLRASQALGRQVKGKLLPTKMSTENLSGSCILKLSNGHGRFFTRSVIIR